MPRKYQRLEEKINGIIPKIGMGATIHVDQYVVPCTIIEVTTTDRRAPMVGVQVDRTGKQEFFKDDTGAVLLFTYRADGRWVQYGYGRASGAVLELAVRRCKGYAVHDTDAVGHAVDDAVSTAEKVRQRLRDKKLK